MIVTRDKQDKDQPELHLNSESRVVSQVWPRCPYCAYRPELWRIFDHSGVKFQVRCHHSKPKGKHPLFPNSFYCDQEPVPAQPVKDSKAAVQAWKVYCAVMKDV